MRSFLPWALLLLCARGAIMLSLGDAFFYGEELEKATAGKAIIDGLDVAHHQLAYHYYEGGGFVISHLKAASFLVFGETLLANKVVALISCLGVLAAGWWACGRAFGVTSSRVFAGLYVFGPATVQKLSLISLGIHHEACLFILLALGLTCSLLEEQRQKTWAALGACLGFGIYFSWVVALAAAVCLIALIVRWKTHLTSRGLLIGSGCMLLGAAPLIAMYQLVGSAVMDIHGTGLGSSSNAPLSESLRDFLRSIYVDGALGSQVAVIAWPFVISLACIVGLRTLHQPTRTWGRGFLCFLGFALIFIAAYLSSAFVQGAVYHFFLMLRLVPLWVVGTVLVAAVVGRGWDESGRGSPLVWCGGGLVVLGVGGLLEVVSAGNPKQLARNWTHLNEERGYVYPTYIEKLSPHLDEGPSVSGSSYEERLKGKLKILLGFDEAEERMLREAVASVLFRKHGNTSWGESYAEIHRIIEAVEPGRFPDYQRGLGPLLLEHHGADLRVALRAIESEGDDAGALSEALGRTGRGLRVPEGDPSLEGALRILVEELVLVRGEAGASNFAAGVGWRLHWVLHRTVYQPWRASEIIAASPVELREFFKGGYEAAAREGRFRVDH